MHSFVQTISNINYERLVLATVDVKVNGFCDNEMAFCEPSLICSQCPDSKDGTKCIRDIRDGKATIRTLPPTFFI